MDANADAPADDVLAWIGEVAGGQVVSARRQGRWRPQWHLRLRTPAGDERALFLRSARDPEQVADLLVTGPDGSRLPLGTLAKIARTEGPGTIQREWGRRRLVVQSNVRGRDLGSFVAEVQERIESDVLVVAHLPKPATISHGQ